MGGVKDGWKGGAGQHEDVRGARCGEINADYRLPINRSRIVFGQRGGIHQELLKSALRGRGTLGHKGQFQVVDDQVHDIVFRKMIRG